MRSLILAGLLAACVGCGETANPPQPKVSEEQLKEVIANAKGQNEREREGRGGPGGKP